MSNVGSPLLIPNTAGVGLIGPRWEPMATACIFAYVRALSMRSERSQKIGSIYKQPPLAMTAYGEAYHPVNTTFSQDLTWPCAGPGAGPLLRRLTTEYTIVQLWQRTGTIPTGAGFGFIQSTTSSLWWQNGFYAQSGTYRLDTSISSGAFTTTSISTGTLATNTWCLFVGRWRSGEKARFDILGVPRGNSIGTKQAGSALTGTVDYALDGAGGSVSWGWPQYGDYTHYAPVVGNYPAAYIFNRRLRDEEVAMLAANPYGPIVGDVNAVLNMSTGGLLTSLFSSAPATAHSLLAN